MSGVCLYESLCLIIPSENKGRRGPGILCKWYTLTILSTCVPLLKLVYLRYGGGGFTTFPWAQAAAHPDLPTLHANCTVYTQRAEQAEPQTSWEAFFGFVSFNQNFSFSQNPSKDFRSLVWVTFPRKLLIFFLVSVFICIRLIHWCAFESAWFVHCPRWWVSNLGFRTWQGPLQNMNKIPHIGRRDRAQHTALLNTPIVRVSRRCLHFAQIPWERTHTTG